MTRGIEERDDAVFRFNVVSTDMLRNSTGFVIGDLCCLDVVE